MRRFTARYVTSHNEQFHRRECFYLKRIYRRCTFRDIMLFLYGAPSCGLYLLFRSLSILTTAFNVIRGLVERKPSLTPCFNYIISMETVSISIMSSRMILSVVTLTGPRSKFASPSVYTRKLRLRAFLRLVNATSRYRLHEFVRNIISRQ